MPKNNGQNTQQTEVVDVEKEIVHADEGITNVVESIVDVEQNTYDLNEDNLHVEKCTVDVDSVCLVDRPSGFDRGLKLDRIVGLIRVNGKILFKVKWRELHSLEYVLYEEMKNKERQKSFEYLQSYFGENLTGCKFYSFVLINQNYAFSSLLSTAV